MEDKKYTDEQFMRGAIELAKTAEKIDEVPVGAIAVRDGKIIAVPDICVADTYAGKDYIIIIYERGNQND